MVVVKEKTCCFTGHRDIPKKFCRKLKKRLKKEIEHLIHQGVIYYGCGGALGFDTLCAQTVLKLKKKYPQIRLILVLPFPGQADGWAEKDRKTYQTIKQRADKVVYTARQYYRGCYHARNRHLVECSSHCICYLSHDSGGTAYTVEYARKQGCAVHNLSAGGH